MELNLIVVLLAVFSWNFQSPGDVALTSQEPEEKVVKSKKKSNSTENKLKQISAQLRLLFRVNS